MARRLSGKALPNHIILPRNVRERSREIYRLAQKAGLSKGRPRAVMMAASVYAACRMEVFPLTLREVAELYECALNNVSRTYRLLLGRLSLTPPPQRPEYFINRVRYLLGKRVAEGALKIISVCEVTGKKPSAVAAAAAYIASGGRLEPGLLSQHFSTTPVTIRKHIKWLKTGFSDGGDTQK